MMCVEDSVGIKVGRSNFFDVGFGLVEGAFMGIGNIAVAGIP
jgi:hypothetical protein